MQRKMLAARADLADKVSEIATRRGTLFDYVNDTLEQAIKAESMGLTLREIHDEVWIFKAAKEAGFTIFPEKIVYGVIDRAYKNQKKELQGLWYETGQWYGKYYADREKFEEMMKKLLWDVSEFQVSETDENALTLTCLSSKFSAACTELFSKFLEGALGSLGYEQEEGEVLKGVINLRFKKVKGQ